MACWIGFGQECACRVAARRAVLTECVPRAARACWGVLGRAGACWGVMGGDRAPAGRAGPGPDVGVLGRVGWAPVRVSNRVFVRVGNCVLGVPCRAGSAPVNRDP